MKIDKYLNEIKEISIDLRKQKPEFAEIIGVLQSAKEKGSKVFICGNGGSAGTANHMKADLFKIAGIKAISLNENMSLATAIINDEGWENLYIDQLKRLFNVGDILISISVHGGVGEDKAGEWSQNLNKAIKYANDNGGYTIGLTGFDGGAMKNDCDTCIVVPAESTPLVEAYHVVLHHYIAFELQEGDRK